MCRLPSRDAETSLKPAAACRRLRGFAILKGERFSAEETAHICERLSRDAYCALGPVLEREEVAALRAAMERKLANPAMQEDQPGDHRRGSSLMRMFEYDHAFRDLIVREPFASLAEAVLGDDCHCMSQNALFTDPKPDAVADGPGGWHVDDLVQIPLPPAVPRHDARVPLPCLALQLFTPLTSIETVQFGPTQLVPGSHYAGRRPTVQDRPQFAGNSPVSMLARPGDAYLFNNQVWHRGAPNVSQRRRLLAGVTYSRRFVAQRFYPFIDYRMPERVWEGAGPRLQRMLGRHRKGPYG